MTARASWRVAVIDDDEDVRQLLHVAMDLDDELGWCGDASDGSAALDLIDLTQPDVVVLDIEMPTVSGLEVLAQLRARGDDVAVVVHSAEADALDTALDRGADAAVLKGQSIDAVLAAIAAACHDRSTRHRDT